MDFKAWLSLRGKTSPAPGEDVTVGDKRGNLARERLRGRTGLTGAAPHPALPKGVPFGRAGAGAPERVHFPEEVPLLFLFFCTKCSVGRVFLLTSGQMFRTIFSSMESKTLYAGFSVTLYPFQAKRACLI